MKNGVLLNAGLSYVIADLGHTQSLAISDSSLPVSPQVEKIDLAVSRGVPSLCSVLAAVLSEQRVEKIIMSQELKEKNHPIYKDILKIIAEMEEQEEINIEIAYLSYEKFKKETASCRAVVRTGEFTPFSSVILVSGSLF